MAEASPLQDRPMSARARRRARKTAETMAVTHRCDLCGAVVAVDPSGVCRLGHRLMSSEAAVERHIQAGSQSEDGWDSGHADAPDEYVSYQDLSVEIDLEGGDGLPPTAPSAFSIALPSASRQVPVSIGKVDAPHDELAVSDDGGLDFFVGGAPQTDDHIGDDPALHATEVIPVIKPQPAMESAAILDTDPAHDLASALDDNPAVDSVSALDAVSVPDAAAVPDAVSVPDAVFAPDPDRMVDPGSVLDPDTDTHQRPGMQDVLSVDSPSVLGDQLTPTTARTVTADDTAPLTQSEVVAFEEAGPADLPLMDPAPDLPREERRLEMPERLRRPLPPRDDLDLGPTVDQFVDLTTPDDVTDVSALIDADVDDLDIADTIPDVSREVTIDPDLAVLDDDYLPASSSIHSALPDTPPGAPVPDLDLLDDGDNATTASRIFTRRDSSARAAEEAAMARPTMRTAGAVSTAMPVLDPPDGNAPDVPDFETQDPTAGSTAPASGAAVPLADHGRSSWSSNDLRNEAATRRPSVADAPATPSTTTQADGLHEAAAAAESAKTGEDWDRMLEPRRTWWDRLAAVVLVLCMLGIAFYLAQ